MARKINKIHFTSVYLKSYEKLPKHVQRIQDKKEKCSEKILFILL
jgi:hypothetical protein